MKAIIMAGGMGTRLRPLTCDIPKPLVKLCGRPNAEYILDLLAENGFDEAVFTLHYLGGEIENYFKSGRYKGIRLSFSYEDEPLGTAGCVKKAAESFADKDEPFLVISGDALCDYDLKAAVEFHIKSGAAATIVTADVDDPREYGLVLERDGRVTGFSEKPSYLSCVSGGVNTGIYVINSAVIELIPEGAAYDFAKDLFPRMLSGAKTPLYAYRGSGSWCDIGDLDAYRKCQIEMLTGKYSAKPGAVKIGTAKYSASTIPDDAEVIPPFYIGRNVAVGEGAEINGCIIGDNVTICKNAKLYGAVVLDGAIVGERAVVNEAIVCGGAKLKSRSSVFEGAVIGGGATVGKDATVLPRVRVWNGKNVTDGLRVHTDIKHGAPLKSELDEQGWSGATNIDATPAEAARLGSAAAALGNGKILVSSNGTAAGEALKNAFISGISAAGGSCADIGAASLSMHAVLGKTLGCALSAHLSVSGQTTIFFRGRNNLPLTREQERKLEAAMTRSEYPAAEWSGFTRPEKIDCARSLYTAMFKRHAAEKLPFSPRISCNSEQLSEIAREVFRDCCAGGESIIVRLDYSGEKVEWQTAETGKISYERLLTIAAAGLAERGSKIALPIGTAGGADFAAESYGGKIERFYHCPSGGSDEKARKIAENEPFLYDGLILSMMVMEYIAQKKKTINEILEALPGSVSENRFLSISVPPQRILSRLSEGECGIGEGVVLEKGDSHVFVRSAKRGNGLLLYAESTRAETAAELCGLTEKKIREIIEKL